MLHFSLRAEVEMLRAERRALYDALAEVMGEDDRQTPCDHDPDPESCTHCRARHVLEVYRPEEDAPSELLAALYHLRAAEYALVTALPDGHAARTPSPTDGGGDDGQRLSRGGASGLDNAGHADRRRLSGDGVDAGGRVSR